MAENKRNLDIQIQNRLIEELTYSNSELQLINTFAKIFQELKSTEEVVSEITTRFKTHPVYKFCTIYLYNDLALYQKGSSFNETKLSLSNSYDAVVRNVAETKTPILNNDFSNESLSISEELEWSSRITVPMMHKDKDIVGVMDFVHPEKNIFKKNNLETLTTIATLAANKIIDTNNFERIKSYQNQLEEYVHIVSHDLKAPLRSINALLYWIKEDNANSLNETTLENFNLIDDILLQMENLISSTLSYSKMDYDISEKTTIDLNAIIFDVKKTVFIPDNIELIVEKELPTFYGEKVKVVQLFQNLISNAIKYNDKEAGKVIIDFTEDESHLNFSIKDNGIGINKRYFSKIFEVFQSLDENKESSGIGLSIVKKIVNHFNGAIWLESEEGSGTTFYFSLRKNLT